MVSGETNSLIRKLGIKIVPLAYDGLLRSDDADLGEDVLVPGIRMEKSSVLPSKSPRV
jgi:hypothetical protein